MFGVRKSEVIKVKKKLQEEADSNIEKDGRYICFACGEWRLRGTFIRATSGPHRGWFVKVCNSARCRKRADKSEYAVLCE